MSDFIRFENVSKIYKSGEQDIKALDNVSFGVRKGDFTVILGPSGSGKSTTLNLLGGMDKTSSGKIIVDDKNIADMSLSGLTNYRRFDVGFVFQFYNLIPNLTAFENVDMAKKISKGSMSTEEAIEAVGLTHRINNFPSQMSGGELQRVSIARAICKNPKLLLCDEPTGALDSETGKKVLILLQKMASEYHNAVIVVTHNAAIAPAADRVIKLRDGKINSIIDNPSPEKMDRIDW